MQVEHPYSVGNWVVSLGRYIKNSFDDTVLTPVPAASGNSGDPLVNLDGDVVGITSGGIAADGGSVGSTTELVALELKKNTRPLRIPNTVQQLWQRSMSRNLVRKPSGRDYRVAFCSIILRTE